VKTHTKLTTLVMAGSVVAASLVLGGTAAGASEALARPGAPGKPKVVKLWTTENKVKTNDDKFRPGVTEFRVKRTAKKASSLIIVKTDDLDRAFKLLGTAFSGGPGSADAMKKFDRIVTIYGGGPSGTRWQVKLTAGAYYVLDIKTNALTRFKVKGEKRPAKMARPDSTVTTTKDNQFKTSGRLSGPWVGFDNNSRELHFMETSRVAERVTGSDVRKALESPKPPKWIRPGGFIFEVQSPGVHTVYRQDVKEGKYLLECFMPSEEQDGVPHAMMGMWKLVHGG
jgi:hypothetical protein